MGISDVFVSRPFYGPRVDFATGFPTIEKLRVEVLEIGNLGWSMCDTLVFNESSFQEFHNCRNPHCTQGGILLGDLVRDVVSSGQIKKEHELKCAGFEGSPKGRKKYGICWNRFKVTIEIQYKQPVRSSPSGC